MGMNFLLKFLPKEKRELLELAIRVTSALDTRHEREEAVKYGVSMLKDGKVTITEWAGFGKRLGIFRLDKEAK